MATPTFLRDSRNIKKYSKGVIVVSENNPTTHLPTTFSLFERSKGSKIGQETEDDKETDDTGKVVANNETVIGQQLKLLALGRDEKVRQAIFGGANSMADKEYTIYFLGCNPYDVSSVKKTEFWVFPRCVISRKTEYEIGGAGKIEFTFEVLENDFGDLAVPMPTGISASIWTPVTATATTVYNGEFCATADIA